MKHNQELVREIEARAYHDGLTKLSDVDLEILRDSRTHTLVTSNVNAQGAEAVVAQRQALLEAVYREVERRSDSKKFEAVRADAKSAQRTANWALYIGAGSAILQAAATIWAACYQARH